MSKIFEFDPVVYPTRIWVSVDPSAEDLQKKFDFLDDNDFIEIVNRVVRMYDAEDFNENDLDYIDDMEMEIADLINDFITDEALDDFGYKYGTANYRRIASNVIRYIQTHLNELY